MEHTDPFETRRRGSRRVRAVTATLAGAAVVGTGALVVVVADQHPAAAASTTTQVPADTDPFGGPPATGLGQAPTGGGPHASSGGS